MTIHHLLFIVESKLQLAVKVMLWCAHNKEIRTTSHRELASKIRFYHDVVLPRTCEEMDVMQRLREKLQSDRLVLGDGEKIFLP